MVHQIHIFHVFFQNWEKKHVIAEEQSVLIKLCVIGVSGKSKKMSDEYLMFFFQFLLPKTPNNHQKMVISMIFACLITPIKHFPFISVAGGTYPRPSIWIT